MTNPTPKIISPLSYPLTGAALIEASAGTGKTYTLALLYIRLVLQQGGALAFHQPLLPPQILVVTFTRAATKELRDRIRQRLVETAQFLRLTQVPANADPLLLELKHQLEAEGASLTTSAYKLEMAAQYMDEAAISTIHGWCYRMLKEHAFDSGNLFHQELIENENDLLLIACQDYWRCFYLNLTPDELAEVTGFFRNPDASLEQIQRLLAHLNLLSPPTNSPAEILATNREKLAQQLAELKAAWQSNEWLPLLIETFAQASKAKSYNARSLNKAHIAGVTSKLESWLSQADLIDPGINFSLASYQRLALLDTNIWQDATLVPQDNPACQALASLPEQLANLPNSYQQLLTHAAFWVANRLEELKSQASQLSNDDLLKRLNTALQGKNGATLAAAIRQKFPVALVDEFQDTDPIQFSIFNSIYQLEAGSQATGFFMIGDPKQAIYAFRGADIYTYLKAKQATSGKHFTLAKNFRSAPGLIAAVNSLFALGNQLPKGPFLFKKDEASQEADPLPFVEVAAGKSEQKWLEVNGQRLSPMQAWVIEADESGKLSQDAFRQQTSQVTASQIASLLNAAQNQQAWLVTQASPNEEPSKRLLQPADLAVLVNSKTEVAYLKEELNLRGVASVYLSESSSVFASSAANLLLILLKAVANPYQANLVRLALAQPQLGLSLSQLNELHTNELAWEAKQEEFINYQKVWQSQGSLALVHLMLHNFKLANWLVSQQDGERQLTDLLHLAELLQEAEVELEGEQALISYLEHQLAQPSLNADLQEQRLESDSQLVQLVTVHKSKGLEYPLVFLPFATHCRQAKATDTPLYLHDEAGEASLHLASNPELLASAEEERLAEDLRKLYVALTRASYCQWLGLGQTAEASHSALGYLLQLNPEEPPTQKQLTQALPAKQLVGFEVIDAEISDEVFIPQQTAQLKPQPTANTGNLTNWWIASYSAIGFETAPNTAELTHLDQHTDLPQEEQLEEETLTQLASLEEETSQLPSLQPSQPEEISPLNVLHYFPAGPVWGTWLHSLLEWAADQEFTQPSGELLTGFAAVVDDNLASKEEFLNFCARRNLEAFAPALWGWLVNFVQQTWQLPELNSQFSLASLKPQQIAVELEFMLESRQVNTQVLDQKITASTLNQASRKQAKYNQLNGLLKGFIDLVVEHQGRYYVIDWKSNRLGKTPADYTQEAKLQQILNHRYDMQYVLYLVALHRLLKARLPNYSYEEHLGGAIYVFLRGMHGQQQAGLFADKPPQKLIEELDALLAGTYPVKEENTHA